MLESGTFRKKIRLKNQPFEAGNEFFIFWWKMQGKSANFGEKLRPDLSNGLVYR